MNKFSNVLRIPTFADLYKEFINRLAMRLKALDSSEDTPMFDCEKSKEDVMMRFTDENQFFGVKFQPSADVKYPKRTIEEIKKEDEYFILDLNILEFIPEHIYNFVSSFCQLCKQR